MGINNTMELRQTVQDVVQNTEITDIHTHLYSPCFRDLLLWGVDELICYHYLIAETMRCVQIPYSEFWKMSKRQQADLIWETLFINNSPYSESCRGVLTVLQKLGLDVGSRDLDAYRRYFEGMDVNDYIDLVLELSGVKTIVMTNDPFNQTENRIWQESYEPDERFRAVLRIDSLLEAWSASCNQLKQEGYDVTEDLSQQTLAEVRRFLKDWITRMDPLYMAASLPFSFRFPENTIRAKLLEACVLPVSLEEDIPFAMMIGVKRRVNPDLWEAGDAVGKADMGAVEYLCANYPDNKFLVTVLSRENQHELCVAGRKYRNLMIFGCWWFLNNPSLIEEITRMRFELLGVSTIPQHSDARVLDQLIYKWSHSRDIIARVLIDKYDDIIKTGWTMSKEEIERDVYNLFGGNFWRFLKS